MASPTNTKWNNERARLQAKNRRRWERRNSQTTNKSDSRMKEEK